MLPQVLSPPTPNRTFLSQPLNCYTLWQPSATAQVGPIAGASIGQAAEVDCEAEVYHVVKSKTSAAIPTPPISYDYASSLPQLPYASSSLKLGGYPSIGPVLPPHSAPHEPTWMNISDSPDTTSTPAPFTPAG